MTVEDPAVPPWADAPPVLELRGVRKAFPGVVALDTVDFDVRRGEVHALLGANGAGKSTLIKIIAGLYRADAGAILIDGQGVELRDTLMARDLGISVIYQDLALVPHLTVAENLFLGREILSATGLIDWGSTHRMARSVLDRLDIDLDANAYVADLSMGKRQLVEIAKALGTRAKLLILDEPTASLSVSEAATLFDLIRQLARTGVGIIYVSHRLDEIAPLAQRVTVLRDGRSMGSFPVSQLDRRKVVSLITGHERAEASTAARPRGSPGAPLLEVRGLGRRREFDDVSFTVHRNEILVLTGLVGAGRTEILETVFGVRQPHSGELRVADRPVAFSSPVAAIGSGIAMLPEDRRGRGLAGALPAYQNITLASLARFAAAGLLDLRRELAHARRMIGELAIKTPSPFVPGGSLSGGNQQKLVLAKWLSTSAEIFLLDEPTQGVDVGAKAEIYRLIRDIADSGRAVLVVSSDLEEVLAIADRILVLRRGRIVGAFDNGGLEPSDLVDAIMHGEAA